MNNGMEIPKLMKKEGARKLFHEACRKLGIDEKRMSELCVYELTDGTRTSTDLGGWEAYFDGGMFVLRLFHIMSMLGAKNAYVLTTGEGHKKRDNYSDIMQSLEKQVNVYSRYVKEHNVRLKFVANVPILARFTKFMRMLNKLENESAKNDGMTVYVLINYSADWAYRTGALKKLPNANVIIKHTKGQVNEGLWLPGKLHNNGFVYAQNGSSSRNWTDKQLVYFAALMLKSMIHHQGQQYQKSYKEGEKEYIRDMREKKMVFVHKKLLPKPTKRVVIFSNLGPEVYEF
ncbi:MAG: hypothetical protein J4431_03175 [Candidatus Aenigmarchaeota archaeon]|nr:hypothetical protein [Candidatus Aenigmarchaeota archaeon]